MNAKIVKDALIIAALKSVPDLKRQPLVLVFMGLIASLPLFFIIVFGARISYGLIGAMVSTITFIGLSAAIQDVVWDRHVKIREMIVAMPVHPLSYAFGVALAPLVFSTPSIIFFAGIALWIGGLTISSLGWLAAALILCWATVSCIGFLISTYLFKAVPFTLNNLSNILALLLGFVPPVYYAEEILGSFSWIAAAFPTSNAVGLIRYYSGSLSLPFEIVVTRWLILIGTAIVSAVITVLKAKWRET